MKKNVARILTAVLMLSVVFSSSVFAAEKEKSAWESFVGLFAGNAVTVADTQVDGITYRTHIQNEGWAQGWVSDGDMSGSEGKGLRLEGIEVKLDETSFPVGMGVRYQTHIQNEGWAQGWVSNGEMSGSEGKGLRLEGIRIELTGDKASDYSVLYRTHIQNEGWAQGWVADGEMSGSEGKGLRLEGIEIKVVQKTADLAAYNTAVAEANAVIPGHYTADSYAALQAALVANVVTSADLQSRVDEATAAIKTAYDGLEAALFAVSIEGINANKLEVILSEPVDAVTAANFTIPGMTVSSAALSDDKTVVTLQVSDAVLGNDYNLTLTGIKIAGVTQADATTAFTMPLAVSMYGTSLTFADGDTFLTADGADQTLVTFKLTDKNGDVVTDADDVEVAFTTTFGSCAENRVTLQNGTASTLLISESLTSDRSALVRATVIEAQEQGLINLTATASILMTPNPGAGQEETVGATLTDIGLEQADRVVLYFNKDVTVEKYTTLGLPDATKATIEVREEVANNGSGGNIVPVIGYKAVPGNSKALYAILDTANVLTDNANVSVNFIDSTGTVDTNSTKVKTLTDARKPAMLTVARDGLRTITVSFSEPVINGATADSAENLENWVIDGFRLDDAKWGATAAATATVGTFVPATGDDTRHIVTITLGTDANGNQIYFQSGTHSVQGAKIGDWANLTDAPNNVMNTQTLDFVVPEDNTIPNATAVVQSPEQYIVSFDKEIVETPVFQLQTLNAGVWTTVATPALKVTNISNDDVTFKVEVMQDWTVTYNTAISHENFYNDNYRLVVAANTVTSAANGKKNVQIDLPLNGQMLTPDVTSPVINSIEKVVDVNQYLVTMSEPIKMPVGGDLLPTLAQGQPAIPQPTAEFIKSDNSVTIPANAISAVADTYDTQLLITPSQALTDGDWTLVVRSISDDVGNTAASATKSFPVVIVGPEVPVTNFVVSWAVADTVYTDGFTTLTEAPAVGQDAVYIKFNKQVKVTGDAANALKTSNYTLNGAALPAGTQIVANILNYNDGNAYTDSVTIVLPDGTLSNATTTVITVSSYLENVPAAGQATEKLSNGGQFKLPFNFDGALYTKLLAESAATTAVETAEASKLQGDVNAALVLVNALDPDVAPVTIKTDLLARLAAVQTTINNTAFAASQVVGVAAADKLGAANNGMVDVTWTALANATSYTVNFTDGVTPHNVVVATNSATITGLTAGTPYQITVIANNGTVNSLVSAFVTGTAVDYVPALAPSATVTATNAPVVATSLAAKVGSLVVNVDGIDAAHTFTLVLDGTTGFADADALATAIETATNGTVALGTVADVTVVGGKLVITNASTGVASTLDVNVTGADAADVTTLTGFAGTETDTGADGTN